LKTRIHALFSPFARPLAATKNTRQTLQQSENRLSLLNILENAEYLVGTNGLDIGL